MKHTDSHPSNIPDTLLVFARPQDYFFPAFTDTVYAPLGIPHRSLRYVIYKMLLILHLPGTHLFWGGWTRHIHEAKRIILFDYGYERGMERYIHRVNPACQVVLFNWNKIDKQHHVYWRFSDPDAIYSTDPGDCARFHFHYNSIFYTKQYRKDWQFKNHRLFFIGRDKGRAAYLQEVKKHLTRAGITCDIRLVGSPARTGTSDPTDTLYTADVLDYPRYLSVTDNCDILLDVNQPGQEALTMRVMESIFRSKKLITNNATITNYDFYNENNIFLLPDDLDELSEDALLDFLKRPFIPYPEEVLDYYDLEAWKERFSFASTQECTEAHSRHHAPLR